MATLPQLVRAALDRDPALPAICFGDRWYTWGDVRYAADKLEDSLAAAGIAPGEPVALVPRNRPEAIAALLCLLAQRRSVRMVYSFQSDERMAAALARPGIAAVVLHDEDFGEAVAAEAARQGLAVIVLSGMMRPTIRRLSERPTDNQMPVDTIEILTSGTTGTPKHFPVSFGLIERHFVSTPLTRSQGDAPQSAPPFLLYFPLANITGLYSTLPTLLRGQRAILLEKFSLEAWHGYVKTWRPAHSGVPPSAVRQILDADIPIEDLASIRAMGVGAAPLAPDVQDGFERRYGIPILLSYGATEFAGPVAMMTAELHQEWGDRKRGSVGKPLPGVQLRIVDPEDGRPLAAGETGLLHVISPRIGEDWIATTDLAMIDADGFLFLKGRADGAIMRGGFKLLPEAIEEALLSHPAIAEAAVVGIDDDRLGQVPAAAIRVASSGPSPEIAEIEAHLRRILLATHIPTQWKICEELPKTASLKVDRTAVKSLF
ncbi:class I adenylate-forming enzyme family protein [Sphingomonas sp. 35-24ZXX]|uniref:class I adenylate-forming enzyme family protein n=1 Tax=Sphingomonas sp. 35-24ZXX TaxID=1545915 RepID=UPI00053C02DA|nr:fatty acid--CoA ligase family protein [Sphingomonas sp. 35-24ZXX]